MKRIIIISKNKPFSQPWIKMGLNRSFLTLFWHFMSKFHNKKKFIFINRFNIIRNLQRNLLANYFFNKKGNARSLANKINCKKT